MISDNELVIKMRRLYDIYAWYIFSSHDWTASALIEHHRFTVKSMLTSLSLWVIKWICFVVERGQIDPLLKPPAYCLHAQHFRDAYCGLFIFDFCIISRLWCTALHQQHIILASKKHSFKIGNFLSRSLPPVYCVVKSI